MPKDQITLKKDKEIKPVNFWLPK